jgi:hypothetical protein
MHPKPIECFIACDTICDNIWTLCSISAGALSSKRQKMSDKDNKTYRILTILDRLNKGEVLNKRHLSQEMLVNEKTIQRDIDDIRAFYSERSETYGNAGLHYNAKKKGYCLVGSLVG